MKPNKKLDIVNSNLELAYFIKKLQLDLRENSGEWVNFSLEDFLEAMSV